MAGSKEHKRMIKEQALKKKGREQEEAAEVEEEEEEEEEEVKNVKRPSGKRARGKKGGVRAGSRVKRKLPTDAASKQLSAPTAEELEKRAAQERRMEQLEKERVELKIDRETELQMGKGPWKPHGESADNLDGIFRIDCHRYGVRYVDGQMTHAHIPLAYDDTDQLPDGLMRHQPPQILVRCTRSVNQYTLAEGCKTALELATQTTAFEWATASEATAAERRILCWRRNKTGTQVREDMQKIIRDNRVNLVPYSTYHTMESQPYSATVRIHPHVSNIPHERSTQPSPPCW